MDDKVDSLDLRSDRITRSRYSAAFAMSIRVLG